MSLGPAAAPRVRGCRRRSWRPGPPRSPSSSASHAPSCCPRGGRCRPGSALEAPHGTTIVTLTYDGGVVMAGDRRATMGNLIANRDMREGLRRRRVLRRRHRRHGRPRDRAGQAVPGRARALREDRGHAAVPGGQGQPARHDDPRQPRPWPCRGWRSCRSSPATTSTGDVGRIFSYDVTGGCYEEHDHHSVGSGSLFARGALKKLWRPGLDAADGRAGGGRGAVRRGRRRLRHRRSGPRPADLADAWPRVDVQGLRFVAGRRSSRDVVEADRAPHRQRQPAEVRDDACRSTSRPSS